MGSYFRGTLGRQERHSCSKEKKVSMKGGFVSFYLAKDFFIRFFRRKRETKSYFISDNRQKLVLIMVQHYFWDCSSFCSKKT